MTDLLTRLRGLAEKITPGAYEHHHTRLSWWIETPRDKSRQLVSGVLPADTWQQTSVELRDGPQLALAEFIAFCATNKDAIIAALEQAEGVRTIRTIGDARGSFLRHLREECGDDTAEDRQDGILSGREDREDYILGFMAAMALDGEQQ